MIAFLLFFITPFDQNYISSKLLQFIILFRLMRIADLLREFSSMWNFEKTLKELAFSIASLMMVLFSLYIEYGEIGVNWFGGWMSYEKIEILMNEWDDVSKFYVYLNFNDYANAYMTLFAIMINNDWTYTISLFTW